MKRVIPNIFIFFSVSVFGEVSWPQWRGPDRNGIGNTGHDKMLFLQEPTLLWDSETIPSQDDGGFGSVITDSQTAYVSLVWHRDVPTNTRIVSDLVLRKLGARKVNLPREVVEKAEKDRLSLSPRLRGAKMEEWINMWLNENLDLRQKMTQGEYLASRFRKGRLALPIELINQLHSVKNRVFAGHLEFDQWLGSQDFTEQEVEKILQAVPPTKREADDVVVALDINTGETLWKTSLPGSPSGRASSSTPCLHEDRMFIVGSNRIFCIETLTGRVLWDREIELEGVASSPLLFEGLVIALVGNLRAYCMKSGALVWENNEVKGRLASPIVWNFQGKRRIICNGTKMVFAVDPSTGKTTWSGPGGGSSTPACRKNLLLVHAKNESVGLIAFKARGFSISELWRYPKVTRRADSSPLIYNGRAYLFGAGIRASFDIKTGEIIGKEVAKHEISSPVMLGNKIFAYEINGSFLQALETEQEEFLSSIYKFKINALRCSSPSLFGTKLLVRKIDRISCYQLCNSDRN